MGDSRRYLVDGEAYTLAEMLAANVEDSDTREWCRAAQIGDVLDAWQAERVECVAAVSL